MRSIYRLLGVGALAVLVSPGLLAGHRTLANGAWGGDRAVLEVAADGAEVEFECARGRITKPIEPDDDGNFDLPGTFSPEGHGPSRGDSAAAQARYKGDVEGDALTLRLTVGNDEIGPYTLTRDRRPILKKCR